MKTIEVKGLSKRYLIGKAKANSVRDSLTGMFRRGQSSTDRELWVLNDVSFDVNDGETLGIIGHNGAGKSTLLKILSRITPPTKGRAVIRGRVGSLLEVGTGFHNELTGRENIFLSGAILGMKRAEISAKFDEIVAFSEIEEFLDTPVKHYSSGMYMRLAFSVAAHLEPEILIVDEILAVGDVGFQRKCLGKMSEAGRSGRTILFVSHDMSAITRLCSRAIWLKNGKVEADDLATTVVSRYLHEQTQTGSDRSWNEEATRPGNETARLMRVRVCDENNDSVSTVEIRRPVRIEMTYEVISPGKVLIPNLHFFNDQGTCIFVSHDWNGDWRSRERNVGIYVSTVEIPGNFLSEGWIFVGAALTTYEPLEVHFVDWDAVTFNVVDSLEGATARGDFAGPIPGVIRPVLDWKTDVC